MGSLMLVAQRVNDLITARGQPICDGCIVNALGLTNHAHSSQITAALGTTSDFVREQAECAVCKNERLIIRPKRR
jgi:hypothetical protein